MTRERLDSATEHIVDEVEQRADELDIDVTLASNIAVDRSRQDDALVQLCSIADSLGRRESELRQADDVKDETRDHALKAGMELIDAVETRSETLIEQIIDEAARQHLDREMREEAA